MPTGATVPVFVRLTLEDAQLLDELAARLNAARPGTIALALRHMARTMQADQPVYVGGPGAGLASITTPPPGMAGVLSQKNARLLSRERALKAKR